MTCTTGPSANIHERSDGNPVYSSRAQKISVPKFMQPETALARLAEDDQAPVMARVQALRQLVHPPLCLLRRLLVDSAKRTPQVLDRLAGL